MIKRAKKSIALSMALIIMISLFNPGGVFGVYAASKQKPARVQALKGKDIQETTVTLRWKKVKNADGYEVLRNKKVVKRLKKNKFTDTGLKSGKLYKYSVRAYKTYKQKQYYNTKTKKWVKSRPKNKEWKGKKTRRVTRRRYGSASKVLKLITKVEDPYAHKIPILTFHRIVSDEAKTTYFKDDQWVAAVSDFEKQIKYLHDNDYNIIDLQEFEDWYDGKVELPKRTAVLTIDDGDYELYYQVYPVLRKYGFGATSFIIGSHADDTTSEYIEAEKHHIGKDLINEIKNDYPQLQFQSHTFNLHYAAENGKYAVDTKTYDELDADYKQNSEFGFEYIAYPFGQYSDDMKKAAKKNGMRMGFAFRKYVCATRNDDRYEIPRIKINGQIKFSDYVKKLKSYLK